MWPERGYIHMHTVGPRGEDAEWKRDGHWSRIRRSTSDYTLVSPGQVSLGTPGQVWPSQELDFGLSHSPFILLPLSGKTCTICFREYVFRVNRAPFSYRGKKAEYICRHYKLL